MTDPKALEKELLAQINAANDNAALEEVRVSALGKKGKITELLKTLGALSPEEKKTQGAAINQLKEKVAAALEAKKAALEEQELNAKLAHEKIDVTLPAASAIIGALHPIPQVIEEIVAIFAASGFKVAEGPDIDSDENNFNKLNIPPSHPARQMHDTFYLEGGMLLRTHTSTIQSRVMSDKATHEKLARGESLRILAPGRTFRSDSDQTHSPMFHQVEGFVIDTTTSFAHLKGCIADFLSAFFGVKDVPLRFRPSFFPFTEPSAEVDIGCSRAGGAIKIGAGADWLEVMGAGMIHPKVLQNCGIDPNIYQGFAFGMGVERLAMLKYGIPDLRTFFESDIRWLKHYGFSAFAAPNLASGV
ncbi:MAG: phenylalanine--tRNA ligase subunit alpha [Dongiaceae bacterium]